MVERAEKRFVAKTCSIGSVKRGYGDAAEIRKFRGAHICQRRADMGHGEIGNPEVGHRPVKIECRLPYEAEFAIRLRYSQAE